MNDREAMGSKSPLQMAIEWAHDAEQVFWNAECHDEDTRERYHLMSTGMAEMWAQIAVAAAVNDRKNYPLAHLHEELFSPRNTVGSGRTGTGESAVDRAVDRLTTTLPLDQNGRILDSHRLRCAEHGKRLHDHQESDKYHAGSWYADTSVQNPDNPER
jgi:hypothetical protein